MLELNLVGRGDLYKIAVVTWNLGGNGGRVTETTVTDLFAHISPAPDITSCQANRG